MNFKKTAISAAVVAGIGLGAAAVPTTASAVLADGSWTLAILPTATTTTYYGNTAFKFGKDGNWQSSFTFGTLPGSMSNGMTDNGVLVNGNGSSFAGDGYAGTIALTVSGGSISVAGTSMTGSVDGAGNMTFTPTGRLGAINSPVMNDNPWNIDNFSDTTNTAWQSLTTGTATAAAGLQAPSKPTCRAFSWWSARGWSSTMPWRAIWCAPRSTCSSSACFHWAPASCWVLNWPGAWTGSASSAWCWWCCWHWARRCC